MAGMAATLTPTRSLVHQLQRRAQLQWRLLRLGALVLALGLSPSSYRAPWRRPLARQVMRAAVPLLPWFTLLAALLSLVIVRIVLVTALSYGLSQFALEMVVRVLVIELIPLTAAFAVALRVSVPMAAEVAQARRKGLLGSLRAGSRTLRAEVVPRALAGIFSVLLLAAVSSALALVLAYLMAHGFTPWALQSYTRIVGHVFSPVVALVFVLKTGALALAVSVLPLGAALYDRDDPADRPSLELPGLVRMFVVILAVEVAGLAGNYL
jgi:phospholipid/cholesterol/gamma-HCH transport system permease protein